MLIIIGEQGRQHSLYHDKMHPKRSRVAQVNRGYHRARWGYSGIRPTLSLSWLDALGLGSEQGADLARRATLRPSSAAFVPTLGIFARQALGKGRHDSPSPGLGHCQWPLPVAAFHRANSFRASPSLRDLLQDLFLQSHCVLRVFP